MTSSESLTVVCHCTIGLMLLHALQVSYRTVSTVVMLT